MKNEIGIYKLILDKQVNILDLLSELGYDYIECRERIKHYINNTDYQILEVDDLEVKSVRINKTGQVFSIGDEVYVPKHDIKIILKSFDGYFNGCYFGERYYKGYIRAESSGIYHYSELVPINEYENDILEFPISPI